MCTVTFLPVNGGVILSSNRDEKKERSIALPPKQDKINERLLFYPTDTKANGTWFIVNDKGDAGVLLNGAKIPHEAQLTYRASRGSILPHIFSSENPMNTLKQMNLQGIENFTLILYLSKLLFVCRWNGENLSLSQQNELRPHIWSSVTLYNDEMIKQRELWFNHWLHKQTPDLITQDEVIRFHLNGGTDTSYRFNMNRDNYLLTVSITSIAIHRTAANLYYYDCLNEQSKSQTIDFKS